MFCDIFIRLHWVIKKDRFDGCIYINSILIRSGSDAVIVYNIRYILACRRSG